MTPSRVMFDAASALTNAWRPAMDTRKPVIGG